MKIGDRVRTKLKNQTPEAGVIVGRALRPYDWWVRIDSLECTEPYREEELEFLESSFIYSLNITDKVAVRKD